MLPRWHIILGSIFTAIIWYFVPGINWFFLSAIFLSSFLIDFDHYLDSSIKTGNWSLFHSLEYHKKMIEKENREIARGIRKKSGFHLFHTIEFHAFIGVLSIFFSLFFYIFLGMFFHSILDLISMTYSGKLHRREFFLFRWVRNSKNILSVK